MSTATVARTVGAIALLHGRRKLELGDAEAVITKWKVEYAEWLSNWKANAVEMELAELMHVLNDSGLTC